MFAKGQGQKTINNKKVKNYPRKDPKKSMDGLVEDSRELIKNNEIIHLWKKETK